VEIALVLGLLIIAITLFATEKLPVDVVTLLLLIVLTLTRILTPAEAFEGFSSDFIIILASIFVISGALQETGMLDRLGSQLTRLGDTSPTRLTIYIMVFTSVISAFMNNTTVTALLVGPLIGMTRKMDLSASKILMPVAFASILGGTCTLIGTSTNVAVSGYMEKIGMPTLGMFELLPVGLILVVVGLVYMMVIGRHMLPEQKAASLADNYSIREYLTEIVVIPGSPLIGQKIFQSNLSSLDIRILQVIRNKVSLFPTPAMVFQSGDLLLVESKLEELLKIKETSGIEIRADMLGDSALQQGDIQLAEVLITPGSNLVYRTLKDSNFRQRFGLVILAVYRHGQTLRDKISKISFRLGDLLLVQGPEDKINYLKESKDLAILGDFKPTGFRQRRGLATLLLFGLAVLVGSLGWAPLSICFLTVAVLCVMLKSMTPEKAYRTIEWRLLILIGGMSAFGTAMEKTGTSVLISQYVVQYVSPFGNLAVMAGFILLTVFLTQPMSNAAAALVVLPVAIQTANDLHVNPRSFAIAIMLSASVSLITPFEPSCILVYGPGKYKFFDFFKVGSLLTLILVVILLFTIPIFWPL